MTLGSPLQVSKLWNSTDQRLINKGTLKTGILSKCDTKIKYTAELCYHHYVITTVLVQNHWIGSSSLFWFITTVLVHNHCIGSSPLYWFIWHHCFGSSLLYWFITTVLVHHHCFGSSPLFWFITTSFVCRSILYAKHLYPAPISLCLCYPFTVLLSTVSVQSVPSHILSTCLLHGNRGKQRLSLFYAALIKNQEFYPRPWLRRILNEREGKWTDR